MEHRAAIKLGISTRSCWGIKTLQRVWLFNQKPQDTLPQIKDAVTQSANNVTYESSD